MSGVNSGFCVVASASFAAEPLGAVSFQSYDACVLPCMSTGSSVGTLRLPVAVGQGRFAATVAALWYVPDDITTTTSNLIAPVSVSAWGGRRATMKGHWRPDTTL